jgi:RNA polymerase sigma-70 factor (ECF subfamily)
MQRRSRQPVGSGDSALQKWLDRQSDGSDDEAAFIEREYRQCVFEAAARQVRGQFAESTWQAFWLTHVELSDTKEVAEQLGLTAGAVYIARSRVLAALKECIAGLTGPGNE